MFILLSSEKNEPRSAAAVIGLCRSAAGAALGGCGTRCAQTLFALILGWLASSRPDKGGGTLYASFWSFRATTRYPEISGLAFYPVSFSAYTFYRAAGPRIGVRGDGFVSYRAATWRLSHSAQRRGIQGIPGRCSFFSAARRTNQEAPPLLSGFVARRLVPPSGAAELAALRQSSPLCLGRLASSRPDKGGRGTLHASFRSFRATMRYPGEENTRHGLENPAGGEGG